ncbi:helix-turn-helix domain-containing protein [Paenibacillus sp. PR3]|uniref:Helix-turn-helix domain-containing protein n=1 Tax=Paenibacillus terricola TaxID=2763503 RepID=A0ABR8N048_9BACL|nr:helix-turn-helix domain-containing protein [Paenibacillus terricola]MBD3921220.1 helix-turn-helix domain-containing protein [Paenibacillus terricola]
MLRNWYFRLLFSYFPILVLTFTIILFLSFIAINEISRSETEKADRISTGYTVDSVERTVHEMEMTVLSEAVKNVNYSAFMNRESNRDAKYEIVSSLRAMIDNNELIQSIYVYRESDGAILTQNGQTELSAFGDQAFIKKAMANLDNRGWSPSRTYAEYSGAKPVEVISMYKRAPLPFGDAGLIVINANLYELEKMIGSMTNHSVSFMHITDGAGNVVYPSSTDSAGDGKVLTTVRSDMLGWTFKSGIQAGQLFGWVSVVSYVWVILAIVTFAGAIVYIIWITRRNYKPIQLMMTRIQTLQLRSDGAPMQMDDLSRIDRTLEKLIHQTMDYEKEQRESTLIQRRQLFFDLIGGVRSEGLEQRVARLDQISDDAGQYGVLLARLDGHEQFQQLYSPAEQNMLKYALGNVIQELAHNEGMDGWGEWIAPDTIAFILSSPDEAGSSSMKEQMRSAAANARNWVAEHLHLSLSFGIGAIESHWSGLDQAFKTASSAMEHQLAIGHNAVMVMDSLPREGQTTMFDYMGMCADIAGAFRLANESWRERVDFMFIQLENSAPKDEDIRSLIELLFGMLGRELKELSDSLRDCFEGEQAEAWHKRLLAAGSLAEMETRLLEWMTEIYRTYVAVSETKSYKAMVTEIRGYIQENFADPDLSLKHLSDRFQISGKYASHLFKLEYDMKFVDYLVQLRMQHAERLLADTEETVQNIALQVGYANSITFGRVFKRTVGVTPGDFRKLKMRPSVPQA